MLSLTIRYFILILFISSCSSTYVKKSDRAKDIMSWCETINQETFTYNGILIECSKEN